jgi:phosphoribosylformimino-5-aminoimidazole carboxamide ribotide isomerase
MLIIPALDLKDKKCVQLVGGVFGSEQVIIEDVNRVAEEFYKTGIRRLHIIDLNAAKDSGDNLDLIEKLLKNKKAKVEVGGGIRTIQKAKELLELGADYIIVGTAAVKSSEFLKDLANQIGKEKIIVSLDYKDKKVLTHGWDKSTEVSPIEMGIKMRDFCGAFLVTCVNKEGQLKGPDLGYLKQIVKELGVPIIASGGISTLQDLIDLKKAGAFGAVIGMAIYKGNINLHEALKI